MLHINALKPRDQTQTDPQILEPKSEKKKVECLVALEPLETCHTKTREEESPTPHPHPVSIRVK